MLSVASKLGIKSQDISASAATVLTIIFKSLSPQLYGSAVVIAVQNYDYIDNEQRCI